jgi:5-methylcytosine-specific restriction protein B
MAYINDLFKIIITEMPYQWTKDWANNYMSFVKDIEQLKVNITANNELDISDKSLYAGLKTFKDYPSFLYKLLYERNNGVSSRGQSVLAWTDLKKMEEDAQLKSLLKEIVQNPNSANYDTFCGWWNNIVKKNNPVLINRAFAACSPIKLTSTVDWGKFWHVANFLRTECDFIFPQDGKNWFEWNEMIAPWLDQELATELSIYSTDLERTTWRNIFYWMLYEFNPASFDFKKQFIKYGAPGTGKTYTCKRDVRNHFALWKNLYYRSYIGNSDDHVVTTQFHPSFTYEDFLEGIRPIVKNDKTELKLVNGIFKSFCLKAAKWEMDIYKQLPELEIRDWNKLMVSDVKGKLQGDMWQFLNEIKEPHKTPLDKVIPPFYFIIDEINRAELSRVLGELMYCLEYRGYEGKIKTQYASMVESQDAETCYWYENDTNYFFIPNNVYLLGTMNNIDRSVESFDFALRRRFQWIEEVPDYDLIANDNLPNNLESVVASIRKLNEKIANDPLLGKDYCIGHAYFMKRPAFIDKLNIHEFKSHIWHQNIKPLLEEYLRGSGENLRLREFEKTFIEN